RRRAPPRGGGAGRAGRPRRSLFRRSPPRRAAGAAPPDGLIRRLEDGAYTFAGEGEPFSGVLAEGERNPYATGERHPGDER
ncbi:hypothetical protein ACFV23_55680, partial [Streptomyces sp. NPDC059627]